MHFVRVIAQGVLANDAATQMYINVRARRERGQCLTGRFDKLEGANIFGNQPFAGDSDIQHHGPLCRVTGKPRALRVHLP